MSGPARLERQIAASVRPVISRAARSGPQHLEPRVQRILELQRQAGNAAVVQLIDEDDDAERTATGKAIFDKGAAYYDKGDFAHAYDEFTRSWELTGRPGLLFSRAQALRRLGARREEAIDLYQQYLDSGETKRTADAAEFIAELQTPPSTDELEADTATGKAIFDKGAAYYDKGDFAHAYDEFTRSWELTGRPGLLFSRAQALRRLGARREEAIDLYQQYLDSGETKRTADAAEFIAELQTPPSTDELEADTATGKAIFDKGAAYYDKGDFAHAYDEFTRSWELTGRPGLLFSRAQALRRLGARREEAIDLYQQYLDSGETKRTADAAEFIAELQTPEM